MNGWPYFYFVVLSESQKWPYYAEIPYSAWPDETMYYNSNGDCKHVLDRDWSYLDVMNWETHENLVVCNAKMFDNESADKTRLLVEQNLNDSDDLLATGHLARLFLYLLEHMPAEYRKEGNVIASSFRCAHPALSAVVADLFMRRLQSNAVWDAQVGQVIGSTELRDRYLNRFPLEASIKMSDEVRHLFSQAAIKYQGQSENSLAFWKTIAQVRAVVDR